MKKHLSLAILLFVAVGFAHAVEQTLLTGELEHGGYGAPVIKFSSVSNDFAVFVGGQGGWIINHKLVLGAGGYGLATDHRIPEPHRELYGSNKLSVGYGGLFFGYIDDSDRIIHPTIQLLIGGGSIEPRREGDDVYHDTNDYDGFFVLEPQMGVEVNFTTFMRLDMSLSYRWVNGVEKYGYTDTDISGPSGTLVFKFGRF